VLASSVTERLEGLSERDAELRERILNARRDLVQVLPGDDPVGAHSFTSKGPALARFIVDTPGSRPRFTVQYKSDGAFTEEHLDDVKSESAYVTQCGAAAI
jgi:hypothetical protein